MCMLRIICFSLLVDFVDGNYFYQIIILSLSLSLSLSLCLSVCLSVSLSLSLSKVNLVTTTAFVPKDVAIKINLLL